MDRPRPHTATVALATTLLVAALAITLAWFARRSDVAEAAERTADATAPSADAATLVGRDVGAARVASAADAARAPASQGAAAAPLTGAAITGTVRRADGSPVEGALCVLLDDHAPAAWALEPGGEERASARSDAAGRFALPAGPGHWQVLASAGGLAPARARHARAGDDLELVLGPALALVVHVVGTDGAALAGARVSLHGDFRAAEPRPLAAATTGDDGRARLEPLAAGEAYLVVRHAGHARRHETVRIDGALSERELRVVLERGAALGGRVRGPNGPLAGARLALEASALGTADVIDVPLDAEGRFETDATFFRGERVVALASAPGRATLERLVELPTDEPLDLVLERAGRTVRGRVVDARGAPVADASVAHAAIEPIARGPDGLAFALARAPSHPDRWRNRTRTAPDGRFELDGLPSGRQLVIAVVAPGAAPVFAWPKDTGEGSEFDLGDVRVEPAAAVFGALAYPDGRPAGGVRLSALRETVLDASQVDTWRPTSWWRPHAATTGADGAFRIAGLAAGRYELFVGEDVVGAVTVQAGRDNGPRTWTVSEARDAGRVRIEGTARDAAGDVVRGLFVGVFTPSADPRESPLAMTFTDVAGRFRLDAPADAELRLSVTDPRGRFVAHEELLGVLSTPLTRDLVLAADAEQREPLIGVVRGPDGAPLSGMVVDLEPPQHRWCGCIAFSGVTDASGVVVFERPAPGAHVARVRDPSGRYGEAIAVGLEAGGQFDVLLTE